MKKAMLITVGTGRTGADIAHGIAYSIRKQNPDLVCLILTPKSKKETLPHLEKELRHISTQVQHCEIKDADSDDVESCYREAREFLHNIIDRGYAPETITVDITSGTKPMSAGLFGAAVSVGVSSISYVTGERAEGGRVRSGTERITILDPNQIYAQQNLQKAVLLFNRYQYQNALKIIEEMPEPYEKETAECLAALCRGFSAWERFDFSTAAQEIGGLLGNPALGPLRLKTKVKQFNGYLHKLKSLTEPDDLLVSDLLSNAYRRREEGKYDDGIARLYRVLEMIGQLEFQRTFGFSAGNVPKEKMPARIRDEYTRKYSNGESDNLRLPLKAVFRALQAAGSDLAEQFFRKEDEFQKLLSARNGSILAHGVTAVKPETFDEFCELIVKTFEIPERIEFPKNLSL